MVLLGEYHFQQTYFVTATSVKSRFALLRDVNISRFAIIFFGNPFRFKVPDLQEEGHFFTSSIVPLSKSDLYTSSTPNPQPLQQWLLEQLLYKGLQHFEFPQHCSGALVVNMFVFNIIPDLLQLFVAPSIVVVLSISEEILLGRF